MTTPTVLWGSMGPDSHAVDTALERAVGKRQSLPHLAQPWANGRNADGTANYLRFPCVPGNTSDSYLEQARLGGQYCMLDWASWNLQNRSDPAFNLNAIIAGAHDAFIHSYAHDAARWGWPVLLRLDSEMNGNWWLWGAAPDKYVAAWRKIVGIFKVEGARNVAWAWVPNDDAPPGTPYPTAQDKLATYYPGDDVVDWTGFDAYNEGSHKAVFDAAGNMTGGWITPWMTFAQTANGYPTPGTPPFSWLGATYDAIRAIAPSKPMVIGEFNSDDRGGDKAAWMADALTVIPRQFPLIRGISLFNWNADANARWALTGSAVTAFAAGVASPIYLAPTDFIPAFGLPLLPPPALVTVADVAELRDRSARLEAQQALQTQALRRILEGNLGGAGGAAADVVALEGGQTSIDVAPFSFSSST